MKFEPKNPPREFEVGRGAKITIKDCGTMHLGENEQITFHTPSGKEYDFARKSWGFYATPSLNGRLKSFDLRAVLIKSSDGKYYIFAVEKGKENQMKEYMDIEDHSIVCWLDSDEALANLKECLKKK